MICKTKTFTGLPLDEILTDREACIFELKEWLNKILITIQDLQKDPNYVKTEQNNHESLSLLGFLCALLIKILNNRLATLDETIYTIIRAEIQRGLAQNTAKLNKVINQRLDDLTTSKDTLERLNTLEHHVKQLRTLFKDELTEHASHEIKDQMQSTHSQDLASHREN